MGVPDHRNVDVVGDAAAGQHGVELLPRLLTSEGLPQLLICAARCGSATAHNADTDFTGEKVRS
jgi:hypothetical protein